MKEKELKGVYNSSSDFHCVLADTLDSLDENAPVVFLKRKKRMKLTIMFVIMFLLLSTTVVGASTEFFGLFSERVGNYGLNLTVETQSEKVIKTSATGVTLDLGYLPEGYTEPYGDEYIQYRKKVNRCIPWYRNK